MNFDNCIIYSYDVDDFVVCVEENTESEFDHKLKQCWEEKMKEKTFRYTLDDVQTRHIPGKYGFIAQLNIKRAVERRKPQFVSSVIMPFDPQNFHFGKVHEKEIIFQLFPKHWQGIDVMQSPKSFDRHLVLINVSPIEYCNSLLVPNVEKCFPQVLNLNGLRLAIETILISHNPALKIGMNGLGAFASVNHLHFHLYYLKETLYLQYTPVKHLSGDCYEFVDFPSEGFAFQILEKEEILSTAKSVMKLINYLQEERIAHNIFITRGKNFTDIKSEDKINFNAIRIYVWARIPSFGSKNHAAFNPALCELAGHLPMKEKSYFENITEDDVIVILRQTCHEEFLKIRDNIKFLYS